MPDSIHLSRMTKLPVVTADGEHVGRLVDVSAILTAETPALYRLAIGSGRRATQAHLPPGRWRSHVPEVGTIVLVGSCVGALLIVSL